jgi:hypothetical protein
MPTLKRISVDQLVVGVYVEEICGPRMNHPFWRTSFLLEETKQVRAMASTGIREVLIDTRKGLDLAPAPVEDAAPRQPALGMGRRRSVSADGEIERAAKICLQSKQAVKSMFDDVPPGASVS